MDDEQARSRADEVFAPIAEDLLSRDGVDIGPMFGNEGLRIRGKVFAFMGYRGALVVKVPQARADELEATTGVERMVMRGRPLREWVMSDVEHAARWPALVAEAYAYVDEITP